MHLLLPLEQKSLITALFHSVIVRLCTDKLTLFVCGKIVVFSIDVRLTCTVHTHNRITFF